MAPIAKPVQDPLTLDSSLLKQNEKQQWSQVFSALNRLDSQSQQRFFQAAQQRYASAIKLLDAAIPMVKDKKVHAELVKKRGQWLHKLEAIRMPETSLKTVVQNYSSFNSELSATIGQLKQLKPNNSNQINPKSKDAFESLQTRLKNLESSPVPDSIKTGNVAQYITAVLDNAQRMDDLVGKVSPTTPNNIKNLVPTMNQRIVVATQSQAVENFKLDALISGRNQNEAIPAIAGAIADEYYHTIQGADSYGSTANQPEMKRTVIASQDSKKAPPPIPE